VIFFIFFCLAVPFGITYYVSTPAFKERFEQWQEKGTAANAVARSKGQQGLVKLFPKFGRQFNGRDWWWWIWNKGLHLFSNSRYIGLADLCSCFLFQLLN